MSTEFWDSMIKGICPCLIDLKVLTPDCEQTCTYEPLKTILISSKKPTKLKLIRTLLITGLFTHHEINLCVLNCYPRVSQQTLANYFTTAKSKLEKGGYIVFRDTKQVYKAIKVGVQSDTTGL